MKELRDRIHTAPITYLLENINIHPANKTENLGKLNWMKYDIKGTELSHKSLVV